VPRYHPLMRLIPWEEERLVIFAAAKLARRHRTAGLRLNHPEAVAIICDAMLEAARAGAVYSQVEPTGRAAVAPADVLDGAPSAAPKDAVTFVASGIDGAAPAWRLGTRRTLVPAHGLRGLTRASRHSNRATAPVEIDVRAGAVSLGGRALAADPVTEVPLSRRYLLR